MRAVAVLVGGPMDGAEYALPLERDGCPMPVMWFQQSKRPPVEMEATGEAGPRFDRVVYIRRPLLVDEDPPTRWAYHYSHTDK